MTLWLMLVTGLAWGVGLGLMSSVEAPKLVLTIDELADMLQIDVTTVYRWQKSGRLTIPFLRLGRAVRVRLVDVEDWLADIAEDARARQALTSLRNEYRSKSPTLSSGREGRGRSRAGAL